MHRIVDAGAARIGLLLGETASAGDWASLIDHTLLKPEATAADIRRLCEEAARYEERKRSVEGQMGELRATMAALAGQSGGIDEHCASSRLLVAQAMALNAVILTTDRFIRQYPVRTDW